MELTEGSFEKVNEIIFSRNKWKESIMASNSHELENIEIIIALKRLYMDTVAFTINVLRS